MKERLFGLTGPEGNHGEDLKELYYYLDATPSHSYMQMLYDARRARHHAVSVIGGPCGRGSRATVLVMMLMWHRCCRWRDGRLQRGRDRRRDLSDLLRSRETDPATHFTTRLIKQECHWQSLRADTFM